MFWFENFPRRVCETNESTIDQIITNRNKNKINVTGIITEISDKDGQLFEINIGMSNKTKIKN